jgi:methylisocitrate lyase
MPQLVSAGGRLREALQQETPLQVVGACNAYSALQAERAGFKALYLSGAGVANASYGLPDLGMTNLTDVLIDVRRITRVTQLPLLVDADTGFGHALGIARTVQDMTAAGAAGIHIEDQITSKRCGHRPGKTVIDTAEMVARIQAAVAAKTDAAFVIMARTDALAVEGLPAAIERAKAYADAGADMLFAEAVTELAQYWEFTQAVSIPVLANITEFGKTPLFTTQQLASVGVQLALYPLSAFRAMNQAAMQVYQTLREQGSQQQVVDLMQTRAQLYDVLNYAFYERQLDSADES